MKWGKLGTKRIADREVAKRGEGDKYRGQTEGDRIIENECGKERSQVRRERVGTYRRGKERESKIENTYRRGKEIKKERNKNTSPWIPDVSKTARLSLILHDLTLFVPRRTLTISFRLLKHHISSPNFSIDYCSSCLKVQ